MTEVAEYLKQFIIAVRRRALSDTNYAPSSPRSIQKLVIVLTENLSNKQNRIPVLQAITGLPITSQKLLTQGYTSALIEEVGYVCISYPNTLHVIERFLESRTDGSPWRAFPWEAPAIEMPDLPEAYPDF